jgi:predicted MFS family arabinose efflux permease
MVPPIFYAERKDRIKPVFLGCVALMAIVQLGFVFALENFTALVILLLGFFVAFNVLEASLPSLVSRTAPGSAKGTALGVYNTTQSLGLFVGGVAGGWLMQHQGQVPVFVFGAVLIALWGISAAGMRVPKRARKQEVDSVAGVALSNGSAR